MDFKGLIYPAPIVRLSQMARKLPAGAVVRVEATDIAFQSDLDVWAHRMGFTVRQFTDADVKTAAIQKD